MQRTAAWLARHALEQVGVKYTFGIPGVHNTELYDEFAASGSITPVLVAHEGGGAFMADAVSRSGAGLGALLIVPAAGVTHAASGIGEAFLDGIPMLVIAGGVRRDIGRAYQLHDMDQHALLAPITKGRWRVDTHAEVVPVIYEACRLAMSGEPGPVFVEIPVDLQLMTGEPGELPGFVALPRAGHNASPAGIGARRRTAARGGAAGHFLRLGRGRCNHGIAATGGNPRCAGRRLPCRDCPLFLPATRCTQALHWDRPRCQPPKTPSGIATACSPSARASPKSRPAALATTRLQT